MAVRSAQALTSLDERGIKMRGILSDKSFHNAMAVHAAFGGSTNLLLHIPAIAHAAGVPRPAVEDWIAINRRVPRIVDVLPNGPTHHPTVRAFLAGGVPEVMLHLRDLGVLELSALTVTGRTIGENLQEWESSERRARFKQILFEQDGVLADDVIMPPARARERGLTSTITFPRGNIAPEGSVIKSTAIDPSVVDADGVYRKEGPARVFTSEKEAIAAIKRGAISAGDVVVLIGCGPIGTGMEETYQLTSALKHLPFGKHVALITDARFSGVSTGACIGHAGPEALAGGPVGKLRDGDLIRIEINRVSLEGSVNFIGEDGQKFSPADGARILASRPPHPQLMPNPALPDDTRLWAALQQLGGGTWGGCVFDTEKIIEALAPATER
jgi:putative YjhG/YagF family dehydratase